MIAPGTVEEELRQRDEQRCAEIREIRHTYTISGMYRNDGATEPLWMVDWYAHTVHLASDGVHLIRPCQHPWLESDGTPKRTTEAVSFFASGRLLRTYQIGELVGDAGWVGRRVSHNFGDQMGLASGEFEYTLTTPNGDRFVFDVRTGEIISGLRSDASTSAVLWTAFGVFVVVVFGVIVAVAIRIIRRDRSRLRRAGPPEAPPSGG